MSTARSLLTVEQAASVLSLHPKTVLRHIRDGRLPATRIGKSYRIERAALDAFAGIAQATPSSAGVARVTAGISARVTAIVEVDAMDAEASSRLASFVGAAALGARDASPPVQVTTAVDDASGNVKVVVFGGSGEVARLLELIELQLRLP